MDERKVKRASDLKVGDDASLFSGEGEKQTLFVRGTVLGIKGDIANTLNFFIRWPKPDVFGESLGNFVVNKDTKAKLHTG